MAKIPEPRVRRGAPGVGAQPEYGQASDVNEGFEDIELPPGPPEGVDLSGKKKAMSSNETFQPQGEDSAFLAGPSEQPWAHVGQEPVGKRPKPENAEKFLPDLLAAAQDPTAPEELHELIAQLSYGLEDY